MSTAPCTVKASVALLKAMSSDGYGWEDIALALQGMGATITKAEVRAWVLGRRSRAPWGAT